MLYQGSKSSHFILLDFLVVEQLVEWVRCKTVSVSSPWECKTSPNHSTSCTTDQKSIDWWLITWDSANCKALARWRISDVRWNRRRSTHIPSHCTKYRGGESMSHPRSFYMDGASITLSWREQMVRGGEVWCWCCVYMCVSWGGDGWWCQPAKEKCWMKTDANSRWRADAHRLRSARCLALIWHLSASCGAGATTVEEEKLNLDKRNVQKRMMKGVRSSVSERVDMCETSVHISNNIVI